MTSTNASTTSATDQRKALQKAYHAVMVSALADLLARLEPADQKRKRTAA